MKIQLVNTYSTDNLGDAAIYASLAAEIRAHGGEPVLIPGARATPDSADAFISVGGDIFNNAREWFVTRNFLANVGQLAQLPGERTMLFGQSIPRSCRGLAFAGLALTLRRLGAVSVRDEISHRRLNKAGVPARLGLDTVFMHEPGAHWAPIGRRLLDAHGVDAERCALISLRNFGGMYRHDTDTFLARLLTLCESLRARGHQPAILIQSNVDGADNDRPPATWLQARLPDLPLVDPFTVTDAAPWEAAAGAVGVARMVLGVRYHASIFRMMQGRAACTLYYSNKGRDLVERLGQPGCDLAAFDPVATLDALERSAEGIVDAASLRRIARADFATGLASIAGPLPTPHREVSYVA